MSANAIDQPDTFGNFRKPKSYGYGNMSTATSILVFAGMLIGTLVLFFFGILVTLGFVLLWYGAVALVSIPDSDHRTVLTKLGSRMAFFRARRAGHTNYLSGPHTSHGSFRLPGVLAATEMTEHTLASGQLFGLLHYPRQHHYVVAFNCEPDGASLLDTAEDRMQVGRWALFMELMASEAGLLQIQVVVETVPDTGNNLRTALEARIVPDAPEFARTVMNQIADTYPTTSADIRTWVLLTYRSDGRGVGDMASFLSQRIPQIMQHLQPTGAGSVRPVDALTWSQVVMVAYDPDLAAQIAAYDVDTMVRWADVGPSSARALRDRYLHENAVSVTFGMSEGPQQAITARTTAALLEPDPNVPRKRVSLVLRPKSPATSAAISAADVKTTQARLRTTRNHAPRTLNDAASAQHTAHEESQGAVIVDFTIMATVTVTDEDNLPDAINGLLMAAPVSRIRLRRFFGSQDSSFAMTLPTGLVHHSVSVIPSDVRERF